MKRKALLGLISASMLTIIGGGITNAAFDENLNMYTLDTVVVEADKTTNKFGDTITEQSYYRTGGDVKVITREEIEKRHYNDVSEAIKRVPGVVFHNPGYRGGGDGNYGNGVAINGDNRVLILVDGRRVDNAASTRSGSKGTSNKSTGVNLDEVTNMENVEKIEVIKGPGASVYGADAMGGVINIITRKGGVDGKGSVDISTGSWNRHNYAVSYSGSAGDDKSLHYFISANRAMSGDSKYKDGMSDNQTGTLGGSNYKEDGVNIRVDKDFDDNHNLKIWYNHKDGWDGNPLTTHTLKYWNQTDWDNMLFKATVGGALDANNQVIRTPIIDKETGEQAVDKNGNLRWNYGLLYGDRKNPGYHNVYTLDGMGYHGFRKFQNNDLDVVYTFNKENGMDSFIRLYKQSHRYSDRDPYIWFRGEMVGKDASTEYYNWVESRGGKVTEAEVKQWAKENLAPWPGLQEALKQWVADTGGVASSPTRWTEEKNQGIQLQYAKSIGIHDIIANVQYDQARNYSKKIATNGTVSSSYVQRKTTFGYLQDKIHINDKWDLTPALRYTKYSAFEHSTGDVQGKGNTHSLTYTLNSEYMFNDSTSMYMGWTNIFRPIKEGDYTTNDGIFKTKLEDEKGNAWTIGVRKELGSKTSVAVHYDWTKMSNAIATLPIWADGEFKSTAVNAKEDKSSINITLDHQFNDHVTLSAAYSHAKDKWLAKNGWVLDPSWGYNKPNDVNAAINNLRPQNHYTLNLSYENGKVYTGLLTNWYTGNNIKGFSSKRFLVLDWNINYAVTKDATVYVTVNNLTNEAYETLWNDYNGKGAYCMPGRNIMAGIKYTF